MVGSSPPVRGAHLGDAHVRSVLGLIPARAGSTACSAGGPPAGWAHPRPCGEHVPKRLSQSVQAGSSPPVRGARRQIVSENPHQGLIPARAGSTKFLARLMTDCGAHPRPCGEHRESCHLYRLEAGSSPPVRGAHLLTWGFIPYTGKIGLLWSQSLRPEYTINNCS